MRAIIGPADKDTSATGGMSDRTQVVRAVRDRLPVRPPRRTILAGSARVLGSWGMRLESRSAHAACRAHGEGRADHDVRLSHAKQHANEGLAVPARGVSPEVD